MKVEKVFTNKVWHPPRRRVKVITVTRSRTETGIDVEAMKGEYPVLWHRRFGNIIRGITLADDDTCQATTFQMTVEDFRKLPECEVGW